MDINEVIARLQEAGLRLPPAEMAAFADLVNDMRAAAMVAQRPLHYTEEPSTMLRLQPAR